MLGGETYETDLYPCRPRHAWRRHTHERNGLGDARHEPGSGLTKPSRSTDGPCLQRMGSLLAQSVLWLRLLSAALLWRLGMASPLLASSLLRRLGVASPLLRWRLGLAPPLLAAP